MQRTVALVRAPVLLLRAERGHLPEERELAARFASVRDLTIETVPGAGHHLHLQQPRLVAERIQRDWAERHG